jgi:hypothetical protein
MKLPECVALCTENEGLCTKWCNQNTTTCTDILTSFCKNVNPLDKSDFNKYNSICGCFYSANTYTPYYNELNERFNLPTGYDKVNTGCVHPYCAKSSILNFDKTKCLGNNLSTCVRDGLIKPNEGNITKNIFMSPSCETEFGNIIKKFDRNKCAINIDCKTSSDDGENKTCKSGTCAYDTCTTDINCPIGKKCKDGNCIYDTCTTSENCSDGKICSKGICIRECTVDANCQKGYICKDSLCKEDPNYNPSSNNPSTNPPPDSPPDTPPETNPIMDLYNKNKTLFIVVVVLVVIIIVLLIIAVLKK